MWKVTGMWWEMDGRDDGSLAGDGVVVFPVGRK